MTIHIWNIAADFKSASYEEDLFTNQPFLALCGARVWPEVLAQGDETVEEGSVVGNEVETENNRFKTLLTQKCIDRVTCDFCILLLLEVEMEENADFVLQREGE